MKRYLLPLLVIALATLLCAQVALVSQSDLTGTAVTRQIAPTGTARWVLFIAASANAAVVRIGDSNVSATQGPTVAPGGGLFFPPLPDNKNIQGKDVYYDLSKIFCYAGTGDKVSILYAK